MEPNTCLALDWRWAGEKKKISNAAWSLLKKAISHILRWIFPSGTILKN